MAPWGAWSACTKTCGGGRKMRSRVIKTMGNEHGKKCGATTETHGCNSVACCFPNCPPDVSVKVFKDQRYFPAPGCKCKDRLACNMRSLLVTGPPTVGHRSGTHMWCNTVSKTQGCAHGWSWCA